MLLDYGMKRGKRARVPVEIGICSVPLRFRSITSKFSHFFFFFERLQHGKCAYRAFRSMKNSKRGR